MDSVVLTSGSGEYTFGIYSSYGLQDIDSVRYNGVIRQDLAGGLTQKIVSFQREIQIEIVIMYDKAAMAILLQWIRAKDKSVTYGTEVVPVVLADPTQYENEWYQGTSLCRSFPLSLVEQNPQTAIPTAWKVTVERLTSSDPYHLTSADGKPLYVLVEP